MLPLTDGIVVESHVVAATLPDGDPITVVTLRDARGELHTARMVGGPNARGGVTRLSGYTIPTLGEVASLDPIRWWTPGTPPGTWDPSRFPIRFTLSSVDSRDVSGEALAELDVALRAWSRPACSGWRGISAGRAVVTAANDGINAVLWHDDVWPPELVPRTLAQTVLHTDAAGKIIDADIHMNGVNYAWSLDGARGTADVRSALTHELGHALGLGHSLEGRATMFASYPGGISWRSLEQDDRDGVCALYPGAGDPGCEAAPCPGGFVCVARVCERRLAQREVCSPCVREVGACDGAGDDARCIDIGEGASAGRVCGRACTADAECGARFRCLPTTSSGDRQCVPRDGCASGPDPCASDAECKAGVCRGGACVGLPPGRTDAGTDGAAPDAGRASFVPGGGCSVRPSGARAPWGYLTVVIGLGFARRRARTAQGRAFKA